MFHVNLGSTPNKSFHVVSEMNYNPHEINLETGKTRKTTGVSQEVGGGGVIGDSEEAKKTIHNAR